MNRNSTTNHKQSSIYNNDYGSDITSNTLFLSTIVLFNIHNPNWRNKMKYLIKHKKQKNYLYPRR
jgi:hypothetical protein